MLLTLSAHHYLLLLYLHSSYLLFFIFPFNFYLFSVQLEADDIDSGEFGNVTYSIAGSSPFWIDPINGDLYVTGYLDRETTDSYTLMIIASDGGKLKHSKYCITNTLCVAQVHQHVLLLLWLTLLYWTSMNLRLHLVLVIIQLKLTRTAAQEYH